MNYIKKKAGMKLKCDIALYNQKMIMIYHKRKRKERLWLLLLLKFYFELEIEQKVISIYFFA